MRKQEVIKKLKNIEVQIAVLRKEKELSEYFNIKIPKCESESLYYDKKRSYCFSCRSITWLDDINSTDFLDMED